MVPVFPNVDFSLLVVEQDALQATSTAPSANGQRTRRPRKCRKCGEPIRGHNVAACNQNNN